MKIHLIINSFSNKLGGAEKLINLIYSNLKKNSINPHILGLLKTDENHSITKKSLGFKTLYEPFLKKINSSHYCALAD